jgi:hypothetical protein
MYNKTTLSIEYAWLFQEMYPGGVFWMSAESNETLQNSISKLAIFVDTVGKNSKETLTKTLKTLVSADFILAATLNEGNIATYNRHRL